MALLDDQLVTIDTRMDELNKLDDMIAAQIQLLHSKLHAHLNVRTFVPWTEMAGTLIWGRRPAGWMLFEDTSGNETPITSCSREIRSKLFESEIVPELITASSNQLQQSIAQRKLAIAAAEKLLAALGDAKGAL